MAIPLNQGDQDDLRAAQESHRGSDRPNAASDEDRAARAIDQSIKIFLPITRRDDGGTVARQDDLAAMSMPTQDQANAPVADSLDEVGIV